MRINFRTICPHVALVFVVTSRINMIVIEKQRIVGYTSIRKAVILLLFLFFPVQFYSVGSKYFNEFISIFRSR